MLVIIYIVFNTTFIDYDINSFMFALYDCEHTHRNAIRVRFILKSRFDEVAISPNKNMVIVTFNQLHGNLL